MLKHNNQPLIIGGGVTQGSKRYLCGRLKVCDNMAKINLTECEFMERCKKEGLEIFPLSNFLTGPDATGNARFVTDSQVDSDKRVSAHPVNSENLNVNRVVPIVHIPVQTPISNKNPISELMEYCARNRRKEPEFNFEELPLKSGFKCKASIGACHAHTTAFNKKDAKTSAARELLHMIKNGGVASGNNGGQIDNKENVMAPNSADSGNNLNAQTADNKNYVSLLYEYCQKMRLTPPSEPEFVQKNEQFFICTIKIESIHGKLQGCGSSKGKKVAKNIASRELLQQLDAKYKQNVFSAFN